MGVSGDVRTQGVGTRHLYDILRRGPGKSIQMAGVAI